MRCYARYVHQQPNALIRQNRHINQCTGQVLSENLSDVSLGWHIIYDGMSGKCRVLALQMQTEGSAPSNLDQASPTIFEAVLGDGIPQISATFLPNVTAMGR
jgi:hypothetical protein